MENSQRMTQLPILDLQAAPAPMAAPKTVDAPKGTYCFVSLGCPKNLVDSERMLGLLQLDGYELVSEPAGADFVVVNTCGFIERPDRNRSPRSTRCSSSKAQGKTRGVIVSGCLAEREKEAAAR